MFIPNLTQTERLEEIYEERYNDVNLINFLNLNFYTACFIPVIIYIKNLD